MKPDDKVAILCKRTDELPDPGCEATRGNCWKCGAEIWVGPNSRRRMREFNAFLYCTSCGIAIMKGEAHAIVGTANQLANLNEEAKTMGVDIVPLLKIDDPDEFLRKRE